MTLPTYPDVITPEPPRCDCMENGAQVCSAYENWCSIAFSDDAYNQLSQAERHALATESAAWSVARTFGGILAPPCPF
jgi:hypothetical protein